jgi:hypothetical protein
MALFAPLLMEKAVNKHVVISLSLSLRLGNLGNAHSGSTEFFVFWFCSCVRVMREDISLHPFFQLLLQGVPAEPEEKSKVVYKERKENNGELLPVAGCWELEFAEQLCQQYAPHVWLPALVRLLRTVDTQLLPVATNFVTSQLQILAVNNVQPDLQVRKSPVRLWCVFRV